MGQMIDLPPGQVLPGQYRFLETLKLPRLLVEAFKLYGVREVVGERNNQAIIGWAYELGITNYVNDEIPWCGLYVAAVCNRAGWPWVKEPLWARNWSRWMQDAKEPMFGDVLVFSRGAGGHVGFYIAEDETHYHVLGGNQGDSVSIVRIAKARLLSSRRPMWRILQPPSVKRYHVNSSGAISTNEA